MTQSRLKTSASHIVHSKIMRKREQRCKKTGLWSVYQVRHKPVCEVTEDA